MALINPKQIHEILKAETALPAGSPRANLKSLLQNAGLAPEDVLENLGSMMRTGESDAIRMRAIDTAAKINGMLQPDEVKQDLTVNIIIQDSQFGPDSINPILIPRV